MSKKWLAERRQDRYYRRAKREGYRSRASYKLRYIQEKFNIIREGDTVFDLGAAPGGWSQVAMELAGNSGTVVGIDLQEIKPEEGITFIKGDIYAPEIPGVILDAAGGKKADVLLSDMSPNISGNYSLDHARSVELCERALALCVPLLAPRGNFCAKVFQGDLFPGLLRQTKRNFRICKCFKSPASRSESSELYVVGKGFIC